MICSNDDIASAAAALKRGELVAFPTETVYGLGADARSDAAVAAIYAAKDRPQFNPLIVHVNSAQEAQHYVQWNPLAEQLAQAFWPGPMTLVLNRKQGCALSLLVSAGMDTVAIRIPAHPVARALIEQAAIPIAAPSANRSGRISPTEASHVHKELGGRGIIILDGGMCEVGLESSVIDARGQSPAILRLGAITAQMLENVSLKPVAPNTPIGYNSPGMLASHYAPQKPLRLNALDVFEDEALLAFGNHIPKGAVVVLNLSELGNLQEAAANLFRMLRLLDESKERSIAVMTIPDNGIGAAINDRLTRAAAPR